MATFLFSETIFGPIKSRRLGISLGVNLLPVDKKICNFNCIYCECGWTATDSKKSHLPTAAFVINELKARLTTMKKENQSLDVITFAGNGEPTLHPQFSEIISATIDLRNQYFPFAKVAVLSNATSIQRESILSALQKVDQNILKLDSGIQSTCLIINKPTGNFNILSLVQGLKSFNGNLIIQTLFLKGNYNGIPIDNTTETEVNEWLKIIKEIHPQQVMIYTLARDTPANNLEKIATSILKGIAKQVEYLGTSVHVSESE
jgi:wyosine [tRNA(Phe)-imidazoG37] synthetase (radical SAM superfamily)